MGKLADTVNYEIRLYSRDGSDCGPLLFDALTEAILAELTARKWPGFAACPYEDGPDEILAIWLNSLAPALGTPPHAIGWKPKDAPAWSRSLWQRSTS